MSSAAAIIGSTGLVGSHILTTLLEGNAYKPIQTITRRAPKSTSAKLEAVVDADTSRWAALLAALSPSPTTAFSALGTTRAAAGSIENQWKIDHDLNIELATAAKKAGVKTFVFISSGGTRGLLSGFAPYAKMKNGVEDAVKGLGFDHAVILKPGVILGDREQKRTGEGIAQTIARGLGKAGQGIQDMVGQDAEVIARAAVRAVELVDQGKAPSAYWVIEAKEIVKLGRAEWSSKPAAADPATTAAAPEPAAAPTTAAPTTVAPTTAAPTTAAPAPEAPTSAQ
ncbi:hypothetical protein DCS_06925 [Drechmeria coniospora]|uniref:NAD-dependent epimerase/dehydratase domain-containing protein n=1 Tax=Drechmeria coniospora TaxID=98403 RepID=A0A151GD40_DRECN|nr:hypothetical protein DCS_06925 [Drechmeria coniospora]KYK54964.1 hypothetical protein DCS_06925 [Drechmeria coniospora]